MIKVEIPMAPAGYEITSQLRRGEVRDERPYEFRPRVEFSPVEFARLPRITLTTYVRSTMVSDEFVSRHLWTLRVSAVGHMDQSAVHDFVEALEVAQRLFAELHAEEVASQPAEVLEAFAKLKEPTRSASEMS